MRDQPDPRDLFALWRKIAQISPILVPHSSYHRRNVYPAITWELGNVPSPAFVSVTKADDYIRNITRFLEVLCKFI
jgi:hypothetical protein